MELVSIHGTDGTNGKLGGMRRFLGYLATLAIGGLVSGLAAIYSAGQRAGEHEAIIRRMDKDVAAHAAAIRDLEQTISELRVLIRREKKLPSILRPDGEEK